MTMLLGQHHQVEWILRVLVGDRKDPSGTHVVIVAIGWFSRCGLHAAQESRQLKGDSLFDQVRPAFLPRLVPPAPLEGGHFFLA